MLWHGWAQKGHLSCRKPVHTGKKSLAMRRSWCAEVRHVSVLSTFGFGSLSTFMIINRFSVFSFLHVPVNMRKKHFACVCVCEMEWFNVEESINDFVSVDLFCTPGAIGNNDLVVAVRRKVLSKTMLGLRKRLGFARSGGMGRWRPGADTEALLGIHSVIIERLKKLCITHWTVLQSS